MAIYQGTRAPLAVLPAGARPAVARPSVAPTAAARPIAARTVVVRRHTRPMRRAHARVRPVTVALAVIFVSLLFGLVYLTQTLQAAVTSYQIDSLLVERQSLQQELQSQQGAVAQWGSEPQIVQWAQQQGLTRLGSKLRIPAR